MSSATRSSKRGGSNPKTGTTVAAASSSSTSSHSATTETIYERQEVETRTRKAHPFTSVTAEIEAGGGVGLAASPFSRTQEKEELRSLNSRLAVYIDIIRSQEQEIGLLKRKVESINTTESKEAQRLADTYDREVVSLRRALDEVSKDLAATTAERDELRTDNKDHVAKNHALEKEKAALQKRLKEVEGLLRDARQQLANLRDQIREHDDEIKVMSAKIRDLQAQVEQLKKELQMETVKRVDAENRLLSTQEELQFQKNLHTEQITNLRNQRVVEVTETETRLTDHYHSKIAEQLDQLRADMEMIARDTRDELERNYQTQMDDLSRLAERNSEDGRAVLEELRITQNKLKDIQGKTDRQSQEYRAMIARLEGELREKDGDIQRLQQMLAERQEELQRTHRELGDLMTQYQELLGERIQLDAELATYHTLLRTEEDRLNLTPIHPFPASPGGSGIKRRRVTRSGEISRTRLRNEASAKGDIHVVEIDADGQFVRLENRSAQDVNVGGWSLYMNSSNGGDNETRYRIHGSTLLKAHSTMTIWSANANVVHDPPGEIVMDGRWLVGDYTSVTLSNAENEDVARREMVRESVVGASGAKRRRLVERDVVDGEEQRNCVIM